MPRSLNGLSVFVASPGGLETERKLFFEIIGTYNLEEGHKAGVSFIPQGHELAFAGAGRPQELINIQIRESDYLLVVFWDKWGSPTADDNAYTSGTEEEYSVGLDCLLNKDMPMKDLAVFFKGASDRQMSDPGEELKKVLGFRKKLETERRILYRTFDSTEEFSRELTRLLRKWTRDWGEGEPIKAPIPTNGPDIEPVEPGVGEGTLVDRAKLAARHGQNTLAHELFTKATTGPYDRTAWTEYVRFLRRTGRFGLLQSAGDQMIEKARDLGDHRGAAEGLSNIGISKRTQGQRQVSIKYLDRALSEVDAWELAEGQTNDSTSLRAFLLDNKGLTWRRMSGQLPNAKAAILEAISLHAQVGDKRGQANAFRNNSVVLMQTGELDSALDSLNRALELFEEEDDERGRAMTLSSIGEVFEAMGQHAEAIRNFELALELNTDLGNSQGKSMNLSQISRVHISAGNFVKARQFAEACMELNERIGNPEGLAAALHALGRVNAVEGELNRSTELLEEALALFKQVDQPAGIAGVALDLAKNAITSNDFEHASKLLSIANEELLESPHFALKESASHVAQFISVNL